MVKRIARLAIMLAALTLLVGQARAGDFLMDYPPGVPHTIGNIAFGLNAVGNSGTAKTVDFCLGNIITMTLTGNVTLTFSNIGCLKNASSTTIVGGAPAIFIFTQDGTGGRTVTWPTTAKFRGSAPVIGPTLSTVTVIPFWSDGTNLYAESAGSGSGGTLLHHGTSNAVVSNAVANFIAIDGASAAVAAASEGDVSTIETGVSVYRNLTCALYTAGGTLTVAGGTNYVMAVRQNIASSTITCTIAAGASSCTDTTHTFTTAALDQIDIVDTPSGTPTALVVKCSVEQDF